MLAPSLPRENVRRSEPVQVPQIRSHYQRTREGRPDRLLDHLDSPGASGDRMPVPRVGPAIALPRFTRNHGHPFEASYRGFPGGSGLAMAYRRISVSILCIRLPVGEVPLDAPADAISRGWNRPLRDFRSTSGPKTRV